MGYKTTSLAEQVFDRQENDSLFGVYPRGTVLTELRLDEELEIKIEELSGGKLGRL